MAAVPALARGEPESILIVSIPFASDPWTVDIFGVPLCGPVELEPQLSRNEVSKAGAAISAAPPFAAFEKNSLRVTFMLLVL